MMPRIIYSVPEVMAKIQIIQAFEESKFSDIPKWDGWIDNWTDLAALFNLNIPAARRNLFWFPYSHLRKAADDQSIYASFWILDKKGL